jgi:hypothetical protein
MTKTPAKRELKDDGSCNPVHSDMAPPWLNPASTIRDGSIPLFFSSVIIWCKFAVLSSIP